MILSVVNVLTIQKIALTISANNAQLTLLTLKTVNAVVFVNKLLSNAKSAQWE
jgi:hypothetical protein